MKNLISKNQRHLLYKDELGDDFLLFKHGEVFKYSKKVLRVWCTSFKVSVKLQKSGLFFAEDKTDEPIWSFDTDVANLPFLIATLGCGKKRLQRYTKKMEKMEERLGHKILRYRPNELN